MRLKNTLFLVFLVLHSLLVFGQKRTFGDVSIPELKQTQDSVFTDAPAVMLYRDVDFVFGKVLHVHERVKIYNAEGFQYSDWVIPFESISGLKAATYNYENGERVVIEVSKNGMFKEEVSEGREIRKLTFPGIKAGSIIELKYKVTFIGLSTLYTQGFTPIKYLRMKVSNGYYGQLSIRRNQYVTLPIQKLKGTLETVYLGVDIPPLREEKFVTNVNNHRGKILMENHGTAYKQTWTSVAQRYYKADWFGKQLKKGNGLYKRDLRGLLGAETDPLVIAKKIDRYVKDTIEWNREYSRGSEYVKTIYRDKKGDSGDINLLLVHMLRSVGLKADPMLVATKNKGWIMYPQLNAFNTLLATIEIDGKRYLLDASKKNTAFGEVPLRYVNDRGLIIFEDGSHELYPIKIASKSKSTVIVNAALNIAQSSIEGDVKERKTNYYALEHRDFYTNLKDDTYEEYLNEIDLFSAEDVAIKNIEKPEKPIDVSYQFTSKDHIESIGGSIYFEPLIIWGLEKNDFNEEDRLYPIDLEYPSAKNYIINYTIPEGYTIESLPEPKLVTMQDGIGYFKFNIAERGNQIQVSFSLEFNEYLIPADYYPALKELYSVFLQITKSKIVLTKK